MNLVQTSLAASVMILLVLLLRGLLLYRWPKKAFAALWMLVLLRLLLQHPGMHLQPVRRRVLRR